jgi:hypothetical protein
MINGKCLRYYKAFPALPVPGARQAERQDQAREQPQTINYKPSIPFNAVQRKDFLSMFCRFCEMCCQHWCRPDFRRTLMVRAQDKGLHQKKGKPPKSSFPFFILNRNILNLKQRA